MLDFLLTIDPLYPLSGLLVGTVVGLTGVGGGSLMTPILVLLFGVHPVTAVGTDLLYAAATKSVGTLVHGLKRTVEWAVVGRLAAGSVPAAAVTLWMLAGVDRRSMSSAVTVTHLLGFALLLTAVCLVFKERLAALAARTSLSRDGDSAVVAATTVAFGAFVGILVTLSSVGAGALGVTVLLLLYPLLPTSRIVGSDIVHAVPLTLLAGLGYVAIGEVDWLMLGSLLLGSIPGIVLGSLLAPHVPERILRLSLATVLTAVGTKFALA